MSTLKFTKMHGLGNDFVVIDGVRQTVTLSAERLRQLGDQEVDIVEMVRGITKYAVVLDDPLQARKIVEKALYLCTRGRPGPVWIDVPIDVQAAPVDFDALEQVFRAMESEGERDVAGVAGEHGAPGASRALDMRYVGQEHAVTVEIPTETFRNRDAAARDVHGWVLDEEYRIILMLMDRLVYRVVSGFLQLSRETLIASELKGRCHGVSH